MPGLTEAEAALRLSRVGRNEIPSQRRPPAWRLLVRQFTHLLAVLLWVAAALAAVAGLIQLAVAIILVIAVNGVFAFVQEYRADRAADRLRDLMPARATVRRDGHTHVIAANEIVPGDVVVLEAGDRISADIRVDRCIGLAVDESLLSGESVPRRLAERDTAYAGTFVVEGSAEGEVTATGAGTRLAGIAALTAGTHRPRSPLAARLHRVVTLIAVLAVAVGLVFFGLGLALGLPPVEGFLFALGVTVALVPEGLLPTVTLSLAWGARTMANRNALVKHLEAVETLGSVTFICTDKTGTMTRNEMAVVDVWTPAGRAAVTGQGYEPTGAITADPAATRGVADLAYAATRASTGRARQEGGRWIASGDPMEAALHTLALRAGVDVAAAERAAPARVRYPFDPRRRSAATVVGDTLFVKGAPESVLARCLDDHGALTIAHALAERGLRVLAVARRRADDLGQGAERDERELELLGLVGLLDPPRPGVATAIEACRTAGIRIAMITGDHPGTARAVASEVGLVGDGSVVVEGPALPADDGALADLLDRDGVVVARVTPEDKLRITRALQGRGHVVAMTGDGVNDAPALREADVGVAMGASGSDVAREAADLVLLDDHFATIVAAVAAVLIAGGWSWGEPVDASLQGVASGTAFAAIVLGQLANVYACRSETRFAFRIDPRTNRLLIGAVAAELVLLVVFLGAAPVAQTLGGSWPPPFGWALAALAVPAVLLADTAAKAAARRLRRASGATVSKSPAVVPSSR